MSPTLSLAPNPITPFGNVRVTGAGFDPTKKVQLALDGSGWTTNYLRPAVDGTFHVGMNVSSKPKAQAVTARYVGTTAIVATASLTVAVSVPPPPPVDPPKPPDVPGPLPTGITPPSSVDRTGKTDAAAALTLWLRNLPPGTKVDLDGGQYFLPNGQLWLPRLRGIELFDSTGKALLNFARMLSGSNASAFLLDQQGGDLYFHDFEAKGASPTPGVSAGEASEHNHFLQGQGLQGFRMERVRAHGFGGDGVYSGGWVSPTWSHDWVINDNDLYDLGRMGFAAADGLTRCSFTKNRIGKCGWYPMDIEPNDVAVGSPAGPAHFEAIDLSDNTYAEYIRDGFSFAATAASASGGSASVVSGITVLRNSGTKAGYAWHTYVAPRYANAVQMAGNR